MILRSKLCSPAGEGGDEGAGSNTPSTGSAASDNRVDDEINDDKGKFVTREAYERLQRDLVKAKGRYKTAESKNNEFETEAQQRAEAKLLEEKEFQKVIDNKNQEIEGLKSTIGQYKTRDIEANKYSAFVKAIGEPVPDKFLPVIPLNQIEVDEGGNIDPEQVKKVAGQFQSTYPEIFKRSNSTPGDFPKGSPKKMSRAEYEAQGKKKGSKWMQAQVKAGAVDFG
jgi:hypothetical protein